MIFRDNDNLRENRIAYKFYLVFDVREIELGWTTRHGKWSKITILKGNSYLLLVFVFVTTHQILSVCEMDKGRVSFISVQLPLRRTLVIKQESNSPFLALLTAMRLRQFFDN